MDVKEEIFNSEKTFGWFDSLTSVDEERTAKSIFLLMNVFHEIGIFIICSFNVVVYL